MMPATGLVFPRVRPSSTRSVLIGTGSKFRGFYLDRRTAELLTKLQQIDAEIDALRGELSHGPTYVRLTTLQSEVLKAGERIAKLDRELEALRSSQREKELDVADLEAKIAAVKEQLFGGRVRAARELAALEEELRYLEQAKRRKEDELLELMVEAEEVSGAITQDNLSYRAKEAELEEVKTRWASEKFAVESSIEALRQERAAVVAKLGAELVALYERLRKSGDGTAVARLAGAKCSGCNMDLSRSALEEIRSGQSAMPRCEYCGRIVVQL